MGVAVYPRLEQLLHDRNLTAADLARLIEARYGVAVAAGSLARLTSADPAGHDDLTVAGAAAAVLGVGLGELFDVQAVPVGAGRTSEEGLESYLDEPSTRRLFELFDRQGRMQLT